MLSLPLHLLVWSLVWTVNGQKDGAQQDVQSLILRGPQTANFCDSIHLSWAGGQEPFTIFTALGDPSTDTLGGDEIEFYTTTDQTVDFTMNFVNPGDSIRFRLQDATNATTSLWTTITGDPGAFACAFEPHGPSSNDDKPTTKSNGPSPAPNSILPDPSVVDNPLGPTPTPNVRGSSGISTQQVSPSATGQNAQSARGSGSNSMLPLQTNEGDSPGNGNSDHLPPSGSSGSHSGGTRYSVVSGVTVATIVESATQQPSNSAPLRNSSADGQNPIRLSKQALAVILGTTLTVLALLGPLAYLRWKKAKRRPKSLSLLTSPLT